MRLQFGSQLAVAPIVRHAADLYAWGEILSIYARAFTVGDLFTETFAVFTANWRAVTAYGVALGLAAMAMQWAGGVSAADAGKFFGNAAVGTMAMIVLASVAGYILTWQLLAHQGLVTTSRSAKIYFFNLVAGCLVMLGTGFAFLLLIVPGFIVMARWSVASQLIIARGTGPIEAMSESWELTRSRQWTIVGFYCFFSLALGAVMAPLSFGLAALNLNSGISANFGAVKLALTFLQGSLQYLLTGLNLCASVAILSLVLEHSGAEEEVFA